MSDLKPVLRIALARIAGRHGLSLFGRVVARRLRKRGPGTVRLHGRPVRYTLGRPFVAMFDEIFENETYRFTPRNPAGRILDVGANIGLATIYFKRLLPRATVVAVEANPSIAEVLRANVASQGLAGVEVRNQAVAAAPGTLRFFCEPGLGSRIADATTPETGKVVEIPAIPLSSLVTDDTELVKLDVEGVENTLLTTDHAWLSRVPHLFFEHHLRADEPDRLPEILLDLTRRGFRHMVAPAAEMPPGFEGKHGYPPFIRQQNVWAWQPK